MDFKLPNMAENPPLPHYVYEKAENEEKYETLKEIEESARLLAESATSDANKSKKRANIATVISILSLLTAFMSNVDKIIANVHFLIDLFH